MGILISYTYPFEASTLFPELDLTWLIKAKASLSKYLGGTSVTAFDKMFLVEFFEYLDYIHRKVEDERSTKMNQIIQS